MNPKTRKAVSPVIATVILVAVAITVAVGVSYWMGGISSQYTQFEKVEIQTGYATYDATNTGWLITMVVKNSGSADATVNLAFLNDVPCDSGEYALTGWGDLTAGQWGVSFDTDGITLKPGEDSTILIYFDNPCSAVSALDSISAGTTVNVKLHSAGGMDYIKLIKLP